MAARLTDMTAHGGLVTGPGAATVLIGKLPAACMGDMHTCPMCNGPVPHVGGPIVMGCFTVFICKKPAARQTDMAICVGPPSSILMGCPTVLIGSGGGGGGGGGGGSASDASSASPDSAEAPASIEGLEAVPIELQRQLAEVQQYMEPEAYELMLQVVNDQFRQIEAGTASEDEETTQLTIADFVDILKKIELDEGYEAALHFAGHLDYTELCNITKAFINGDDTNADNDPNLMPTKYMILYGADDSRLTDIADHPDCTDEQEHKINVANLRKALILQGAEIPETGPYDDDVYIAFLQYAAKCTRQLKMDELEYEANNQNRDNTGILNISLDIDPDDPKTQDDTFTLYSCDSRKSYSAVKTVKDDLKSGNDTLELMFENLDKSLRYTLEIDTGQDNAVETIFKNKAYGKWD